jgi:dephospho-CoA kinase
MTQFPLAMITGGIGIGKTTVASIVLPYLAHWVLCPG